MHLKSIFFYFKILFQILCHSFRLLGDFQSFKLELQKFCPPTIHFRLTIFSWTIVRFQGSIAIRLHLSLRGRSLSSFGLHFEQMNSSGISFRDIWTQVRWYQTVHLSQFIQGSTDCLSLVMTNWSEKRFVDPWLNHRSVCKWISTWTGNWVPFPALCGPAGHPQILFVFNFILFLSRSCHKISHLCIQQMITSPESHWINTVDHFKYLR